MFYKHAFQKNQCITISVAVIWQLSIEKINLKSLRSLLFKYI